MIKGMIPEVLINIHKSLFLESRHFWKCSHLKFLYVIGYNNISWTRHKPVIPKSGSHDPQVPRIDAFGLDLCALAGTLFLCRNNLILHLWATFQVNDKWQESFEFRVFFKTDFKDMLIVYHACILLSNQTIWIQRDSEVFRLQSAGNQRTMHVI